MSPQAHHHADPFAHHLERAQNNFPFIPEVERAHGLPHGLLVAVGSRETEMQNIRGDHQHGHGVWQLDDRAHRIPDGFDANPRLQAETAASMLEHLHQVHGTWEAALNAYNSGHPDAAHTTGGNYGPDVMNRLAHIQQLDPPDHPGPPDPHHGQGPHVLDPSVPHAVNTHDPHTTAHGHDPHSAGLAPHAAHPTHTPQHHAGTPHHHDQHGAGNTHHQAASAFDPSHAPGHTDTSSDPHATHPHDSHGIPNSDHVHPLDPSTHDSSAHANEAPAHQPHEPTHDTYHAADAAGLHGDGGQP